MEKKGLWTRRWELLVIALVALILAGVVSHTLKSAGTEIEDKAQILSEGWYYWKEGVKETVELPAQIQWEGQEQLTLYNDSLTAADGGKVITTKGAQYDLVISLDGKIIYEYEDPYFPRNTQMKSKLSCDADIPTDFQGGTLSLTCHETSRGNFQLFQVYVGSGKAIMLKHLVDEAAILGIAFLFIILSIIAVGIACYIRFTGIPDPRFVDAALFLTLCSCWFITDSSLIQSIASCTPAVCVISFYAFMLLAIPMLYFVKNTGEMKKYRILDVLILIFSMNAAVQGVLNRFLGMEFVDMLFVTHILLTGGVAVCAWLLIKECRLHKTRELKQVLWAFITVSMGGVLALLLYWILKIPYYGSIFQLGILIFVVLTLSDIVISMAGNIHYKTEMETYQRMASTDWMTGLKNRQPFEEMMTEIQRKVSEYGNSVLIFMDVNQLKTINDQYGRGAGDEIILAAAKCIVNTFSRDGECFRIGGDEFSVILKDPHDTKEQLFERLDQEIAQYNQESRYKLSIARGWSELRKEGGEHKTISDWKYEADNNMYVDKGRGGKHERI